MAWVVVARVVEEDWEAEGVSQEGRAHVGSSKSRDYGR